MSARSVVLAYRRWAKRLLKTMEERWKALEAERERLLSGGATGLEQPEGGADFVAILLYKRWEEGSAPKPTS